MRCLRSPALQKITGTSLAAPHALTRRGKRPASRIRWGLSSSLSLSLCPRRPPHPKPARVMPERVERVEHDPIHTVIAARHQIRIMKAELVAAHPLKLRNHPPA